jgi:hypothetical protein
VPTLICLTIIAEARCHAAKYVLRPTWDPDGRESIPYHYSRLLALTVAVELASDRSSTSVAKAIRDESNALCDSYFRWCNHMLDVWSGSIHRTAP